MLTLYELGARNFMVNNIAPLGCLPLMIHQNGNDQCDEQMNLKIVPYINKLPLTLQRIQSFIGDDKLTLTLADSHSFLYDALGYPKRYGKW
ncbi:hypothetical protein U1Q18_016670 [Sarracenia purpurea var. burkii]